MKKAILHYMTWSSPMNQAFIIEALRQVSDITFEYQRNETNITKIKQVMKLYGVKKVMESLIKYATAVVEEQDNLRESMKNSFISADSWIRSAQEALEIQQPIHI